MPVGLPEKRGKGDSMGFADGFTLVEIISVMAIVAVLIASVVPASMKWIERAKITRYVAEARGVWNAIQIYSIETYEGKAFDSFEMMEKLTWERLSSEKNPLNPYLQITCSKGAEIENLTFDMARNDVVGIVYLVGDYRIVLDREHVEVRPRNGTGSAGID